MDKVPKRPKISVDDNQISCESHLYSSKITRRDKKWSLGKIEPTRPDNKEWALLQSFPGAKIDRRDTSSNRSINDFILVQPAALLFTNNSRGNPKARSNGPYDFDRSKVRFSPSTIRPVGQALASPMFGPNLQNSSPAVRMDALSVSILSFHVPSGRTLAKKLSTPQGYPLRRRLPDLGAIRGTQKGNPFTSTRPKESWDSNKRREICSKTSTIDNVPRFRNTLKPCLRLSHETKIQSNLQVNRTIAQATKNTIPGINDRKAAPCITNHSRNHRSTSSRGMGNYSINLGRKHEVFKQGRVAIASNKRNIKEESKIFLQQKLSYSTILRCQPPRLGGLLSKSGRKARSILQVIPRFNCSQGGSCSSKSPIFDRYRQICMPAYRQPSTSACHDWKESQRPFLGGYSNTFLAKNQNQKNSTNSQMDTNSIKFPRRCALPIPKHPQHFWSHFFREANSIVQPIRSSTFKSYRTADRAFESAQESFVEVQDPYQWLKFIKQLKTKKPSTIASYLSNVRSSALLRGIQFEPQHDRWILKIIKRFKEQALQEKNGNKCHSLISPKQIFKEINRVCRKEESRIFKPLSRRHYEKIGYKKASTVASALVMLATGCRVSDARMLRTSDFDFSPTNHFRIKVHSVKTNSVRFVTIPNSFINLRKSLRNFFKCFPNIEFMNQTNNHSPLSTDTLSGRIKNTFGIPSHDLRRIHASYTLAAGVPERQILQVVGWSDNRSLKRYAKPVTPIDTSTSYFKTLGFT